MTMEHDFWHEKLEVYQRTLAFVSRVEALIAESQAAGAVLDHLDRAAESIAENIVNGNSQWSPEAKCRYFGIAYGSSLECAACLDVLRVKNMITDERCDQEKAELRVIVRMLIGLIRSHRREIHEPREDYETSAGEQGPEFYFDHETLQVYQFALRFVGWVHSELRDSVIDVRRKRKLDQFSTSIVLNIAEGNGRYGRADHRSFLDMAHQSALKAALQLDLIRAQAVRPAGNVDQSKELLRSIVRMLLGMRGYFDEK